MQENTSGCFFSEHSVYSTQLGHSTNNHRSLVESGQCLLAKVVFTDIGQTKLRQWYLQ